MISIFTPTHDTKHILDAYKSLLEQTYTNWEWVILVNNMSNIDEKIQEIKNKIKDARVKIIPFLGKTKNIGLLKNECCSRCSGDILVELDHDDLLVSNCLQEINDAFLKDPEITMVYSDWAQVDKEWNSLTWSSDYGWEFYDFEYKGKKLSACVAPEPHPANIGRIYFAPNHVRAWRTSHYKKMGGHNKTMEISDDHELIARSFVFGKIHLIKKCLYIYRVHGENTWLKLIPEIRETMWQNYTKYIVKMMEKWSEANGLLKIDLCGGINKKQDFISLDLIGGDITANLDLPWPIKDNSVGVVWASDAVEHLADPIHTMNEIYRVLAPGGMVFINVPSTKGEGAWCDPTHKSFWNKRSFRYYTEKEVRKYIEPKCYCKFQTIRLLEGVLYDGVPYVFAHLAAIKPGVRLHGLHLI